MNNNDKARLRTDMPLDFRQRFTLEQSEKALQRAHDLAQQSSAEVPPDARIRQWEKIHGLNLPRDPGHPVLDLIASATGLTLREVRVQQHLRFARPRAEPGVSAVPPPPQADAST